MATAAQHDRRINRERQRQHRRNRIRVKLNELRVVRLRIKKVKDTKPVFWQNTLKDLYKREGLILGVLKGLGWKPRKKAAAKPSDPEATEPEALPDDGQDLELAPEERTTDSEEEMLAQLDATDGNVATEGNWIYGHGLEESDLGADAKTGKPFKPFAMFQKIIPKKNWSKPMAMGASARVQTQPGTRAMVMEVKPGLFVVQLVPQAAAQKLAGDNGVDVGVVPLLLLPGIAQAVKQRFNPVPAPAPGQPGGPGYVPPPAPAPTAAPHPTTTPGTAGCECQQRPRRRARR